MSRHKSIDPDVERELDALESALNGDAGADPQLLALVEDVRAQAPIIDGSFQAALQTKVAAGFPRDKTRLSRGLDAFRTRELFGAVGVAGALVAMIVVLAVVARDDRSTMAGSDSSKASSVVAPEAASQDAAPEASRRGEAADSAGVADELASTARKVERAARLSLTTSADDVQSVADGVVRETQAAGGYVVDSNVSTSAAESRARFTLRIPTAQLDKAIASLSKLANVGALSQDSRDITSPYESATDRLRGSKAERQGLLKALANASSAGEIASLKQRLAINEREIASADRELRRLQRRSSMSTVAVDVTGTGERKGAAGWSVGDAFGDALALLVTVAGVAIVGLAAAIPALVFGGLAWLLIRALHRRWRNAILNSP